MRPIDGGLATELEARGHDLGDTLWSARILADSPAEIGAVHRAYVDAGAHVVVTASYQVSREGFVAVGRTADAADAALRASVELAREAVAGSDALVAASVGPFGAIRHDGSEYRGRYGVSRERLIDFHSERLEVLMSASPDLLAIETVPDLDEVDALVEVLRGHPDLPAWLTMTCADSAHTSAGQPIEDLAEAVRDASSIRAVGVNCSAPELVHGVLARLADAGAPRLIAYPNAGQAWSPDSGWAGNATGVGADLVATWREVPGLALVGGCCGIGPDDVAAIARSLDR
ncbi:MAG: homocysteine S-methyltransferase [Candidatus Nanopelagicales bacterium]